MSDWLSASPQNLEALAAATASSSADKISELASRGSAQLQEEIADLKRQLAHSKSAGFHANIQDELQALQEDKETVRLNDAFDGVHGFTPFQLQQSLKQTQADLAEERAMVEELRSLVNERSAELDIVRKKLNREGSINGHEVKIPQSPSSKHDLAVARDEITGLKYVLPTCFRAVLRSLTYRRRHIVQELQKENTAANQRCKVLEAENRLLLSETEQLREVLKCTTIGKLPTDLDAQDLKVLEEDVEKSLAREEALANGETPPSPGTPSMDDIQALQRSYKELKTKYEVSPVRVHVR